MVFGLINYAPCRASAAALLLRCCCAAAATLLRRAVDYGTY
jgi:hypothetical protein